MAEQVVLGLAMQHKDEKFVWLRVVLCCRVNMRRDTVLVVIDSLLPSHCLQVEPEVGS